MLWLSVVAGLVLEVPDLPVLAVKAHHGRCSPSSIGGSHPLLV